jgi:hypothetical protein
METTEAHRLRRVFGNTGAEKIFKPKRNELTRDGEDYIIRSFVICHHH